MTALVVVCVAAGGLIGAPARYLVDRIVTEHSQRSFPLGTFLINISGSFLLGALAGLGLAGHLPVAVKALVGTGFCGAFTTFSTWSFETVRLIEEGELTSTLMNTFGSVALGLGAAAVGVSIGLIH